MFNLLRPAPPGHTPCPGTKMDWVLLSSITKKNGRSTIISNGFSGLNTAVACMVTVVTAAASVPSSVHLHEAFLLHLAHKQRLVLPLRKNRRRQRRASCPGPPAARERHVVFQLEPGKGQDPFAVAKTPAGFCPARVVVHAGQEFCGIGIRVWQKEIHLQTPARIRQPHGLKTVTLLIAESLSLPHRRCWFGSALGQMKGARLGLVFVERICPFALEINRIGQNHPRQGIERPLDDVLDFPVRAVVRPVVDDFCRFGFRKSTGASPAWKNRLLVATNPGLRRIPSWNQIALAGSKSHWSANSGTDANPCTRRSALPAAGRPFFKTRCISVLVSPAAPLATICSTVETLKGDMKTLAFAVPRRFVSTNQTQTPCWPQPARPGPSLDPPTPPSTKHSMEQNAGFLFMT